MNRNRKEIIVKTITTITFFSMVIINWLAQGLIINGVNPKLISDSYPNLFAPAAITFSIWGTIYLLLAAFTFYQDGLFQGDNKPVKANLLYIVGIWFSISSIANICWIFAWNYYQIALSMFFMIIILMCLIVIHRMINYGKKYTLKENILIKIPFSVYFGWITVAAIANATTLLVSLKWSRFGISESVWVIIIIIIGMLIGSSIMIRYRDIAYGISIIWAYFGILIEHISYTGYSGKYPNVIFSTGICIAILMLVEIYIIILKLRNRKLQLNSTL